MGKIVMRIYCAGAGLSFTRCCILPAAAAFCLLLLSESVPGSVEILFSPRDNINYRIIETIDLSRASIDVATFDFSSIEIADALVKARRKGLKVRLLVDKNLLEDEDSQARSLEEIGFDVKPLKGKGSGVMKNAFIIFDGSVVIVGPYNLSRAGENYNYENAILFDDPHIVETYQNEFDRLFGSRSVLKTSKTKRRLVEDSLLSTVIKPSGPMRQRTEADTSIHAEGPAPRDDEKPEPASAAAPPAPLASADEGRVKVMGAAQPPTEEHVDEVAAPKPVPSQGTEAEEPGEKELKVDELERRISILSSQDSPPQQTEPEEPMTPLGSLLDISFEELDKIFGKSSPASEEDKEALWPNYMGRNVKWSGEVTYTMLGIIKGTRIGFRHLEGSDTDVEVRFSIKKATKILKIAEGDIVTYKAKLYSWPTPDTPYYILQEGTLE